MATAKNTAKKPPMTPDRTRKQGPKPTRSFRAREGHRVEVYVIPANRNAPATLAGFAVNLQVSNALLNSKKDQDK
jgi:hypothetical protein